LKKNWKIDVYSHSKLHMFSKVLTTILGIGVLKGIYILSIIFCFASTNELHDVTLFKIFK
jgi:hypothetical protein